MTVERALTRLRPRGRLSRRAYGRRIVRLSLAAAVLLCVMILLGASGCRIGAIVSTGAIAALGLVGLALTIRRLHDRGRTGWWLLLGLGLAASSAVPVERLADDHPIAVTLYALAILATELWFLTETFGRRGTSGTNRYGPKPNDD